MAMLPYAYDPTTQDLFLYEDHTISWTLPTPGSSSVKRPYAWNPDSPLYGYRKSLHGIAAPYRTFSTTAPGSYPVYSEWNDPYLEVNKPAFYNSFPPHALCIHPRFMVACMHCFFAADRNPYHRVVGVGGYTPGTALAESMLYRFIDSDDGIIDIPASDVIGFYNRDTSIPFPAVGQGVGADGDSVLAEFLSDQPIEPIKFTDAKSCGKNATAWFIDGSMKIIRMSWERCYTQGNIGHYRFSWRTPDNAAVPEKVGVYLHDSGSRVFVEVKPPTSAEAGDGVLAALPNHVFGAGDFVYSAKNYNYMEFDEAPGVLANSVDYRLANGWDTYLAARGYSVTKTKANRKSSHSLQSVDDQIFIIIGTQYGSFVSPTTASNNYGTFASLTSTPSNYGSFGVT